MENKISEIHPPIEVSIDQVALNKTKIGNDPVLQQIRKKRVDMETKLRISGFSYREIADAVKQQFPADQLPPGYSEITVSKDIERAYKRMDELDRETLRVVRRMDLQRLDAMMMVTFNRALGGDLKGVKATLDIMERRAKLLGLDKPTQVEVKDWRTEVLDLVRSGRITIDEVRREFGTQIAREIIESGGETVIESYFAESENSVSSSEGNVLEPNEQEMASRILALGKRTASDISQGTADLLGQHESLDDNGSGESGG
jgi:hypothetical protein